MTRPLLQPAPLIPLPMVLTLAVLASTPLWLGAVGLYQYLALEIIIWMMFAMAHNLLLGQSGLPSFGHGAYFGLGAYAVGLLQQRADAGLLSSLLGALVAAGLLGAVVGAVHLAPPRHLLRAADHRLRPGVLVCGDQIA